MIQIHKVEDLEVAIQMGVLIPSEAPPMSRHRFWIVDRRLDVFKNRDGVLFLHWVRREVKGGKVVSCPHPHPKGFSAGRIYPNGGPQYWYYNAFGDWKYEFTPAPTGE